MKPGRCAFVRSSLATAAASTLMPGTIPDPNGAGIAVRRLARTSARRLTLSDRAAGAVRARETRRRGGR
jgi:hypothetical protein